MKDKIIIAVMKDGVQKKVIETNFPDKHEWKNMGLQVKDLLVFDKECDLVLWIEESEE